ncbi:hypothetical protein RRG08_018151 [Elysia crispata]|uniref:Uncharacterized protein n=1 Tax=Elysia crispata TaxID=231223 RepID=A0AAE1AYT4_9GAST|nr:hypothetical protein RRG08_018151 [Elysia crispata]
MCICHVANLVLLDHSIGEGLGRSSDRICVLTPKRHFQGNRAEEMRHPPQASSDLWHGIELVSAALNRGSLPPLPLQVGTSSWQITMRIQGLTDSEELNRRFR